MYLAKPVFAKYPFRIRSRSWNSSAYLDVKYIVHFSIRILAYHLLFVNLIHGFVEATDLSSIDSGVSRIISANATVSANDEVDRIVDRLSGVCSIHRTHQNESLVIADHGQSYRKGTNKTDFQLCHGVISYESCVQPTIDQLRQFSEDVTAITETTYRSTLNNSSFPITINCCQGYKLRTKENGTLCSPVCSPFCLIGQCIGPNDCASCQTGYVSPFCTAVSRTKLLDLMACDRNNTNKMAFGKLAVDCGSCGRCAVIVAIWLASLLLSVFILIMVLRRYIYSHSHFVHLDNHSENEVAVQ